MTGFMHDPITDRGRPTIAPPTGDGSVETFNSRCSHRFTHRKGAGDFSPEDFGSAVSRSRHEASDRFGPSLLIHRSVSSVHRSLVWGLPTEARTYEAFCFASTTCCDSLQTPKRCGCRGLHAPLRRERRGIRAE